MGTYSYVRRGKLGNLKNKSSEYIVNALSENMFYNDLDKDTFHSITYIKDKRGNNVNAVLNYRVLTEQTPVDVLGIKGDIYEITDVVIDLKTGKSIECHDYTGVESEYSYKYID